MLSDSLRSRQTPGVRKQKKYDERRMMTPEEMTELSDILLNLVPKNGAPIGNVTLSEKFVKAVKNQLDKDITTDDYWEVRNKLIEDNKLLKGRGKGGSVSKVIEEDISKVQQEKEERYAKEGELYDPLKNMLYEYWPKENNIKNFILEVTASQGRRATGGRWTRPDIAIVSVNTFSYLPGKFLEVTTFEIKPKDMFEITGAFETAAHLAFAHYAFLAVHVSKKSPKDDDFERLKSECRRLGVGLMTFLDPAKYETMEIVIDPQRAYPPPFNVNDFIHRQVSQTNQNKILEMIK